MARPRKEKTEVRGALLQVRVLDDERELFRKAAKESGLEVSSWVRERLLQAAKKELRK
jgi:uncharacterized protein (DUF1778 family)